MRDVPSASLRGQSAAEAAAINVMVAAIAEHSAALKFRLIWSWTYLALRWVLPIG